MNHPRHCQAEYTGKRHERAQAFRHLTPFRDQRVVQEVLQDYQGKPKGEELLKCLPRQEGMRRVRGVSVWRSPSARSKEGGEGGRKRTDISLSR